MSSEVGVRVTVRRATIADSQRLWEWRNEPSVREASFSTASIPRAEHEPWLAARLADPDSVIYIVLDGGGREIGYVRFDADGAETRISVALAREARGLGLGSAAIREGVRAFRAVRPGGRIVALILPDNRRSEAAFLKAGFVREAAQEVGAVSASVLAWPPAPA